MALEKKENLVIVNCEEFDMTDKHTGENLHKVKYTFIDQNQNVKQGYTDERKIEWEDKIISTDRYADEFAVEVKWTGRVFEGETKWKLS